MLILNTYLKYKNPAVFLSGFSEENNLRFLEPAGHSECGSSGNGLFCLGSCGTWTREVGSSDITGATHWQRPKRITCMYFFCSEGNENYIVTCQAHPVLVKSGSNVRSVSFLNFLSVVMARIVRSSPPVNGPNDPWPRVLSLPGAQGGFVRDPTSLARDNIF